MILTFLIVIFILICFFIDAAYPVFKSSCENTAKSKGVHIINQEVNEIVKNINYSDLISIEKDESGKVNFIKMDTTQINKIVSQINLNIQDEFDKIPRVKVFINMGTISGISMLNKLKPQFEIELESAGILNSNVNTEFTSVGINQTQHKIYLNVSGKIGILTPFGSFSQTISSKVLLTDAVIVGEVPDTYYNLEGIENEDETYNFIE